MDGLGGLDRQSRIEDFSHEIAGLLAQVLSELGALHVSMLWDEKGAWWNKLDIGQPP